MREIIEEYANVIVGGTAAAVISGLMAEFFLGGSGFYEIVMNFSQSIC
ncbi:MAG: hypothetical protein HFH41_03795 [Lachnospiraceae bacterium]|nr:hypothetical protein [Lachnospiraceae bacterium]